MIVLLGRHRLPNLRNCNLRCILSIKTTSPFGDTAGVEGDVSAIAKTISPDSRHLVNLNAIVAVKLVIDPLSFRRD